MRKAKIYRFIGAVTVWAFFGWLIAIHQPDAQPVNPGVQVSGSPANNDCSKFVVSGGNVQSITTTGGPCAATGVASFNSRTGTVVPQADDYGLYQQYPGFSNCTFNFSVASNNLTASLQDNAGNTPSSTSPCPITFGNSSPGSSAQVVRVVTGARTVTINSGSTLGTTSSVPFRIWVVAVDTGSDVELALYNASTASQIFPLVDFTTQIITACNACATATAAGTFYGTAGFAGNRIRVLGWGVWATGQTTAGVWANNVGRVQVHSAGNPLPGAVLQVVQVTDTSNVTQAAQSFANTNTTLTISPKSQANLVAVAAYGIISNSAGTCIPLVRLARNGSQIGLQSQGVSGGQTEQVAFGFMDSPGSVGGNTYTVQIEPGAASCTASWNGGTSGTGSTIIAQEIQG